MVPTLVAFGLLITAAWAAGNEVADMSPVYPKVFGLSPEIGAVFPII